MTLDGVLDENEKNIQDLGESTPLMKYLGGGGDSSSAEVKCLSNRARERKFLEARRGVEDGATLRY